MTLISMISLSPRLRTNAVKCLLILIFCSLQSIISSVTLLPVEQIKTIWNNQNAFITCKKDRTDDNGGTIQWFKGSSAHPIDDNSRAPVYVRANPSSLKLIFSNPGKKFSDIYECRNIKNGKVISSAKVEIKISNAIDMAEALGNKLSYVGIEGHSFTIYCTARFDTDSKDSGISWRHNNHAIDKNGNEFSYGDEVHQSTDFRRVRSALKISRLRKDHEGVYVCQADYANDYMTDVKEIEINLRVQFKPRFLEKNHKNVWISDDSSGDIAVNVTCLVNADPVATFTWSTAEGMPISQIPGQGRRVPNMPDYTIMNTENMSVLSLKYSNINKIHNNFNDPEGKKRSFKCHATNTIGDAKQDFIINIGKLPDPPVLGHTSYENGILWLSLNQTEVKPPVDMYRVDIGYPANSQIYFNESYRVDAANSTYRIDVDVPTGTHQLVLYAHNPVGWSNANTNEAITPHKLVISSASVVQQYLTTILMASALALRYAL